jgi:hypothetical protein
MPICQSTSAVSPAQLVTASSMHQLLTGLPGGAYADIPVGVGFTLGNGMGQVSKRGLIACKREGISPRTIGITQVPDDCEACTPSAVSLEAANVANVEIGCGKADLKDE